MYEINDLPFYQQQDAMWLYESHVQALQCIVEMVTDAFDMQKSEKEKKSQALWQAICEEAHDPMLFTGGQQKEKKSFSFVQTSDSHPGVSLLKTLKQHPLIQMFLKEYTQSLYRKDMKVYDEKGVLKEADLALRLTEDTGLEGVTLNCQDPKDPYQVCIGISKDAFQKYDKSWIAMRVSEELVHLYCVFLKQEDLEHLPEDKQQILKVMKHKFDDAFSLTDNNCRTDLLRLENTCAVAMSYLVACQTGYDPAIGLNIYFNGHTKERQSKPFTYTEPTITAKNRLCRRMDVLFEYEMYAYKSRGRKIQNTSRDY